MEGNADMLGWAAVSLGALTAFELMVPRVWSWARLAIFCGDCLVAAAGTVFLFFFWREMQDPTALYASGFPESASAKGLFLAEFVFAVPLFVYCAGKVLQYRYFRR